MIVPEDDLGEERDRSNVSIMAVETESSSGSSEGYSPSALGKALLKLSLSDREAIREEIHGVRTMAVEETPELLENALKEFQKEIDLTERNEVFPGFEKKTYNLILRCRSEEIERNKAILRGKQQLNITKQKRAGSEADDETIPKPSYIYTENHYAIDDGKFRLRFLRVELFDVPKAVTRFLRYLNFTYEFWGTIALERPIHVTDLLNNKEDRTYLKKGYHQIIPFRDRSGRKVVVNLGFDFDCLASYFENLRGGFMWKGMFYVFDAVTRDCVETQRLGLVDISETHTWDVSKTLSRLIRSNGMKMISRDMERMLQCIPVRLVALHTCLPVKPLIKSLLSIIYTSIDSLNRQMRVVPCYGTQMECRYQLKSFGIPTELYPITQTEKIKFSILNQWISTRQQLEEIDLKRRRERLSVEDVPGIVECPCLNDVVFRQGKSSLENPGNATFRYMLLNYFDEKEELRRDKQQQQKEQQQKQKQKQQAIVGKNIDTLDEEFTMGSLAADPLATTDAVSNTAIATTTSYGDADDRVFCDWLIHEIEVKRKGRFLIWDRTLTTWLHIKTNKRKGLSKIKQKIMISIYNCHKKASASLLRRQQENEGPQRMLKSQSSTDIASERSGTLDVNNSDINYRFIEGGRRSLSQQDGGDGYFCGGGSGTEGSSGNKRRRDNDG